MAPPLTLCLQGGSKQTLSTQKRHRYRCFTPQEGWNTDQKQLPGDGPKRSRWSFPCRARRQTRKQGGCQAQQPPGSVLCHDGTGKNAARKWAPTLHFLQNPWGSPPFFQKPINHFFFGNPISHSPPPLPVVRSATLEAKRKIDHNNKGEKSPKKLRHRRRKGDFNACPPGGALGLQVRNLSVPLNKTSHYPRGVVVVGD